MPVNIGEPKKRSRRTRKAANKSMEQIMTDMLPRHPNPTLDRFTDFVFKTLAAIQLAMDHQREVGDTDPVTIAKRTSETIKKIQRFNEWA